MSGKRLAVDTDDLIRRYVELGEGTTAIARSLGCTQAAIYKRLRLAGVPLRSRAEANLLTFARLTDAERRARAEAHSRATRGRPVNEDALRRAAITRQRTLRLVGRAEREFAGWLEARGLEPTLQLAVDRYNIDVAVLPVAVEILHGPHAPQRWVGFSRKVKYLTDLGWYVLCIWAGKRDPVTERTADDAVAFREFAERHPASIGAYRVIRGTGELLAAGRGDFDQVAHIPASRNSLGRRID